MNLVPPRGGHDDPPEPFVPDFSEGAETGLYLALLELLDEGLLITGDETIIEVNSAACRLLERDYRELAGRPLAGIFPSESAFLEARARLFIHGEMRGSLRVAVPGGERSLRFIAAARMRPGIHVIVLNPEFGAAEQSQAPAGDTLWPRLAAALEQPVIVVDEGGRVAAANAAALRALDASREALVGRPLDEFAPLDWPGAGEPPIAQLRLRRGAVGARVLPGPRAGWRLLVLPATNAAGARSGDSVRLPARGEVVDGSPAAAELRRALAHGELEVHFQPLIDTRDRHVRGGEALLRWRHPRLGRLGYAEFEDAARRGGLVPACGDRALRAACLEAARWAATEGIAPLLTVNVAMEQIVGDDFPGQVREALQDAGLAPGGLELDLEERVLEEDDPRIGAALHALASLGVRLAIDGFGRGLASIARLKRYPLSALKLDPSLVCGVGRCEEDEAIVEAIVAMAGVLGLQVLGRGVETEAQRAFLGALGCHLQQGPLFGAPMAAAQFHRRLAAPAG